MKHIRTIIGSTVLIGVMSFFVLQGGESDPILNDTALPQVVKSIKHKSGYNLAGEMMPNTMDAKERLDREMTKNAYWHSSSLLIHKLANKFFPVIEPILAEEGVPNDFKYLAIAESGLRNVTSRSGAKGFWQFMKLAASEYQLEINKEVDERYHLEKSTRAAAKYLKKLKNKFGSWTNAAAAYNMGMTAFTKNMKSQKESNYYNMNMSIETNRYVFRVIALKEIIDHPETYGFYLDHGDKYYLEDYYSVKVTKTISNLGDFAHQHGTTYRLLKKLNPWLLSTSLTVKKNTYFIKIPKSN